MFFKSSCSTEPSVEMLAIETWLPEVTETNAFPVTGFTARSLIVGSFSLRAAASFSDRFAMS